MWPGKGAEKTEARLHLYWSWPANSLAFKRIEDAFWEFEILKTGHRCHQMCSLHNDVELVSYSLPVILRKLTDFCRQLPACIHGLAVLHALYNKESKDYNPDS